MFNIVATTTKDIPTIQEISSIVWPVTFSSILSQEQIVYMMDMMYSTESLTRQMEEDQHNYVLIKDEENNYLGYLSYQLNIDNTYTKIHKIYVLPDLQRKGVGRALVGYAADMAKAQGNKILTLNVNRYNKALGFYEHLGFSIAETVDINIGNGFLMEDYVLSMSL